MSLNTGWLGCGKLLCCCCCCHELLAGFLEAYLATIAKKLDIVWAWCTFVWSGEALTFLAMTVSRTSMYRQYIVESLLRGGGGAAKGCCLHDLLAWELPGGHLPGHCWGKDARINAPRVWTRKAGHYTPPCWNSCYFCFFNPSRVFLPQFLSLPLDSDLALPKCSFFHFILLTHLSLNLCKMSSLLRDATPGLTSQQKGRGGGGKRERNPREAVRAALGRKE